MHLGHIRLGYLPKTHSWQQLVSLLDDATPETVPTVASATIRAAEAELRRLAREPMLGYCVWLLTRVAWASRSSDFVSAIRELGIDAGPNTTAVKFIGQLVDRARAEVGQQSSSALSDLSVLALRQALGETVGVQPSGLFGSSLSDVQQAFRRYSGDTQFGALTKTFFANFLSRTLSYFVDKELANHLGTGKALGSVSASDQFLQSLDVYTRQSALITERFASEWYSKHNWASSGEVTREEAHGFASYALQKLRSELKRGRTPTA